MMKPKLLMIDINGDILCKDCWKKNWEDFYYDACIFDDQSLNQEFIFAKNFKHEFELVYGANLPVKC